MSSYTAVPACGFQNEALNMIFGEVQKMVGLGDGYIGVAFVNERDHIGVVYTLIRSIFHDQMRQPQQYPGSLWTDLSLAMRLIDRIAYREGLREFVRWFADLNGNCTCWKVYPKDIGDNALPTLRAMLKRVDAVIKNLDAPLDKSGAN